MECYNAALTLLQEFSIEIPDKEADAIHSGMLNENPRSVWICLTIS